MEDLSIRLKALADPTRLTMLNFLLNPVENLCCRDEGICASDFENLLELSQPAVSHHMKLLVQADFVIAEKKGRWVFYELNPNTFGKVAAQLMNFAKSSTVTK